MTQPSISYKRHRFPLEIIANAVWLYVRFNLSLREVEEMMLERGIDVSYETVRRWTRKFGSLIARNLRRRAGHSGSGVPSIRTVSSWMKSSSLGGTSARQSGSWSG